MKTLVLFVALVLAGDLRAQTVLLEIRHLGGGFHVYTTYRDVGGSPFPSNSLYVVTKRGVIMIDTPWDTTQTRPLLDSIAARHRQPVVLCVVTHYHDDRTAGLDVLRERGIPTWSTRRTDELAAASGDRRASHVFERDTTFTVGGITLRTYYPGEGHTRDNIVIWFPASRVLYGGCLVKSVESPGLGNLADANVGAWERTITRVIRRYPKPRVVIPGHFGWQSRRALRHTLELVRAVMRE
ncbi:MAG TPA: subclass B1 metallo-beta-lactamase [Candidatus Kapabacteria bacterium]|jgi:glyoxylase-like metal-dependent hydrolase (beta-lactamase superfamily II)|nr:subclass B1 metallo-beta-lactamase [Candidatus Kapabacteria bacterium]